MKPPPLRIKIYRGRVHWSRNIQSYHPLFDDDVTIKDDGETLTFSRASMFQKYDTYKAYKNYNGNHILHFNSDIPFGTYMASSPDEDTLVVDYKSC